MRSGVSDFQRFVDANEMLIEAKTALEEIRQEKMPGGARVIAIKMLQRIAEYEASQLSNTATAGG